MIDKKSIAEYVERVFDLYGLDKCGFFYETDFDDDSFGEDYVTPLFVDGYESEETTILRVSQYLGLTTQEVVNCDKKAAFRYWDKFPFFSLHNQFLDTWIWNANYKGNRPPLEEVLVSRLFDFELAPERRYDLDDVNRRFYEKLEDASKFDSRYLPEQSYFHLLEFATQEMFSFPKCNEMVRAYLDMIYRVQSLFFKAVEADLPEEEQLEYNFLVSFFELTDLMRPTTKLYYEEVVRIRGIVIEEGYKEFWSYAKIHYPTLAYRQPWRCIEFFEDREMVQEFVDIFPFAKHKMIEFSRLVKNFRFEFQWKEIKKPEHKEKNSAHTHSNMEDDENYNPNPILVLYLEKTAVELADFKVGLENLLCVASPPAKGGVRLPKREFDTSNPDIQMIMTRRLLRRLNGGKHDE